MSSLLSNHIFFSEAEVESSSVHPSGLWDLSTSNGQHSETQHAGAPFFFFLVLPVSLVPAPHVASVTAGSLSDSHLLRIIRLGHSRSSAS
jgi:hypothetical protein